MASPAGTAVGLALAVAAVAAALSISVPRVTATVEAFAACALAALIGTAHATESAPGMLRGASVGSCPMPEFGPEGMQLHKAGSADEGAGEMPVATATAAGTSHAAASIASGGCSAAVPPPVDAIAVAMAADVPPDTLDSGEVRSLDDLVEPAQRASRPEAVPEAETMATSSVDTTPKPVVAPTPSQRAKPVVVPDQAKKAWWPANQSGKLNLEYAGQASFGAAIVLLFDGTFDTPDSANRNIQVKTHRGNAVSGQWVVATNRQMLLFSAPPGVYAIDVGAGLADKGGRIVSAPSSGLVAVQ